MSRRTKLKVRNMRLFLTKNVFNSRYIVRNILAFTIMVTVVAMCAGAGIMIGNRKEAKADTVVASGNVEEVVTLDGSMTSMNAAGTNMIRADLESVMTADKEAKEKEVVAAAAAEFTDKCAANRDDVNVRAEASTDSAIVGHMNIGAGRIIYQDLTRITKAIEDGDFFKNKALLAAMDNCKKNDSDLHLWGLLSDGGVHSHITHLYGLLEMAKKQGLSKVYVHAFLDGRDTPPASGKEFIEELEKKMKEIGVGKIASLSGRYYAMDRDNNWDRVQKAYDSLTKGEGVQAEDAVKAMEDSYAKDVTDEFVLPTVITENGKPVSVVKENDSVIFFNFRPDRAREMTRAFCDDKFTGFDRPFIKTTFVCFKDYDETIPNKLIAFEKEHIVNTFGEYLAKCGKTQLRLAETEKYAHVTFFFNGGVEEPNVDEARLLVNSPKDVATYDLKPEMSAPEVGMDLVEAIKSDKYDVIVINFANPDMVGHTGVIPAAIKAVERVDGLVGDAVQAVKDMDGVLFICADHGNAEKMIDYETGEPHTAHTTNPVPFILVNADPKYTLREGGCLADIAPTLLQIMGLEQPKEMTGKSLLIEK